MLESENSINQKSSEQVEQEKMTRRAALRKFGFGAGLSTFLLLGVDDLARIVGNKMAQMEGDNKVAKQIAKEFQSAGVALADDPSGDTCFASCPGKTYADDCQSCCDKYCSVGAGCEQYGSGCASYCYQLSKCDTKPVLA